MGKHNRQRKREEKKSGKSHIKIKGLHNIQGNLFVTNEISLEQRIEKLRNQIINGTHLKKGHVVPLTFHEMNTLKNSLASLEHQLNEQT